MLPYLIGVNPNSFLIFQGEFGTLRVSTASKEHLMPQRLVIELIEKDSDKVWGRTFIDGLDPEKDFQLQLFLEAIQAEPILLTQFVWTDLDCSIQRGLKEILIHPAAGLSL